MKKIYLLVLLSFLGSCSLGMFLPEKKFNENKELPYSTKEIITNLELNGFFFDEEMSEKLGSMHFINPNGVYISVDLFSENILDYPKAIFVSVSLANDVEQRNSEKQVYISNSTLRKIKTTFSFLECNNERIFLEGGFVCRDSYRVVHKYHTDGLEGIREKFGAYNRIFQLEIYPQ